MASLARWFRRCLAPTAPTPPAAAAAAESAFAVAAALRTFSATLRRIFGPGRSWLLWRPRWPYLVLQLLWSGGGLARSRLWPGSAPSTASPPARALLPFLNRLLRLLLRAVATLLRPLGFLAARLLSASTLSGWALRRAGATFVLPAGPGALFKLSELLFHEAPALGIAFGLALIESAVGTPFPALGVHLAAGRAEYAFRKRHRESARIVHFALCDRIA